MSNSELKPNNQNDNSSESRPLQNEGDAPAKCQAPPGKASESSNGHRAAWWPALLLGSLFGISLVAIGYAMHGKPLAEKTITTLSMPVGITWLVLTGRVVQLLSTRRLHHSLGLGLLWLGITVLGTNPFGSAIARQIERSVDTYRPDRDGKLDYVIVLGGGTTQGSWRSQVSGAGDRLVLAAELYYAGHAKQLITTGSATKGVSRIMVAPTEQTIEIWTRLGIPRSDILAVPGRNTFEELQSVKQMLELAGKRVGLLTSAIHLPRAMRLAKSAGVSAIPIAAEETVLDAPFEFLDFIPNAGNLSRLNGLQHELLAKLVSR